MLLNNGSAINLGRWRRSQLADLKEPPGATVNPAEQKYALLVDFMKAIQIAKKKPTPVI